MSDRDWAYCKNHRQLCKAIESQTLWGDTTCHVRLPSSDSLVRIPASSLKPFEDAAIPQDGAGTYIAATVRVVDALTLDILLAPIESSGIPLPHQIRALFRAISSNRIRYLLAEEVMLGKTIEAGLVMCGLKLRGLVTCTLVIALKGLVPQWVAEMRTHFNEDFPSQGQRTGSHGKE